MATVTQKSSQVSPIRLLTQVYHAGKVGLNYLIDRNIELNNLILMDYYTRISPQRWRGLKWLAKSSGNYTSLIKDMPRLPAMRLAGKDWSLIYVGQGQSLMMIEPLFFPDKVSIENLGRISLWNLPAMVKQWSDAGAGLIVQETSQIYQTQVNGRLSFRIPSWVQQVMPLPDSMEAIQNRSGEYRDFRRVIKKFITANFSYSFSTSEADFYHFYHNLYLPFIASRHGKYALVTPYADMLRWFQRGGLILVQGNHRAKRLAGIVTYLAGETAYAIESGFTNDYELWQMGINDYLFWSILDWAVSQGAKQADFGGSFPVRTHGVFTHKRRWGAKVVQRKRIIPYLTCIEGHISPGLEEYINQMGLITEIHGKHYGVLLGKHRPEPTQQEVMELVRTAGRDGLAGIALYRKNSAPEIFPVGDGS